MKKLITWPKSALDAMFQSNYLPHVDYLYAVLGFIAGFCEFVVILQLGSVVIAALAFAAIWLTGWLCEHYDLSQGLVYTFGAWLFSIFIGGYLTLSTLIAHLH